jgi:hypothetical protein
MIDFIKENPWSGKVELSDGNALREKAGQWAYTSDCER